MATTQRSLLGGIAVGRFELAMGCPRISAAAVPAGGSKGLLQMPIDAIVTSGLGVHENRAAGCAERRGLLPTRPATGLTQQCPQCTRGGKDEDRDDAEVG